MAREKPRFLNGLFTAERRLGKGGMGQVLEVEANSNCPGFPVFLADMIAWREATREVFPDLVSSIRKKRSDIGNKEQEERDLQDRIDELNEMRFRERGSRERQMRTRIGKLQDKILALQYQMPAEKTELRSSILRFRDQQLSYVVERKRELVQRCAVPELKAMLGEQGVILPNDLRFALKIALKPSGRMTRDREAEYRENLRRIQEEGKSLIALDYPGLVNVYSFGPNFTVSELVRGVIPPEKIFEEFNIEQKIQIHIDAAEALDYTHRRGVLHRDMKPDNVLVSKDKGKVCAKVSDFGLAKTDFGVTKTGILVGTPLFMSPEQAMGAKYCDERSDIYSLGATLYFYITGIEPFSDVEVDNIFRLLEIIQNEPVKPPSEIFHTIPPDLEAMTLTMMAKDPEERPQSMREVAQMLKSYLRVENKFTLSSRSFGMLTKKRTDKLVPVRRRRKIRKRKRAGPWKKVGIAAGIIAGGVIAGSAIGYSFMPEEPRQPVAVHVDELPTRQDGSDVYAVFAKEVINLGGEVGDYIRSGSLDKEQLASLTERVIQAQSQAQKYRDMGIPQAAKLLEELDSSSKQLAPLSRFVSRNMDIISQVSNLEKRIEGCYNPTELQGLLRAAESYTHKASQIARKEGKIAEPLVKKAKSSKEKLESQIQLVQTAPLIMTFDEGSVVYNGQEDAWRVLDQSRHKNHGRIHGRFAGDRRTGRPIVFPTYEAGVQAGYEIFLVDRSGETGRNGDLAMGFNGGYIEVPDDNSLDLKNNLILSLYVCPSSLPKSRTAFICKYDDMQRAYELGLGAKRGPNDVIFFVVSQTTNPLTGKCTNSRTPLTPSKWVHIKAVFQKDYNGISINHKLDTEEKDPDIADWIANSNAPLVIGCYRKRVYFKGTLEGILITGE